MAESWPAPAPDFDEAVRDARVAAAELSEFMSNVEVVVEEEPPAGMPLLGLYEGIPLTRRGAMPDGAVTSRVGDDDVDRGG